MRRALVVGAVVVSGAYLARRRWRPQWDAAVAVPVALVTVMAATPAHWWDDAWSGVTGIAGDIKDWVLGLIGDVADWLDSSLSWLGSRLTDALGWIGAAFDAVYGFARDLVDGVIGWVSDAIGTVARWVGDLVGGVWNWIQGTLAQLWDWLAGAFGQVWDWLGGLAGWIWDNVVNPLWDMIQWVWHNIVEPAVDWLTGLIGDLYDTVKGIWDALTGWIGTLWDFCFHWAVTLLHVVEGAFDWLVKLAEHGPGWVIDQVEEAFKAAPAWLAQHLLGAVESQGDAIEQFFADWLG